MTRDSHGYIQQEDPQTLNLYAYAENNPVSKTDPNGNMAEIVESLESSGNPYAMLIGAILGGILVIGSPKSANKLNPDPDAEGDHSTYKRNSDTGEIDGYETWKPQTNPNNPNAWESVKKYHGKGRSDYNKKTKKYVDTPHVHDPLTPGGVRPPSPWEIPMIEMLKQY